ncbi:MAG: twin-arginine translocase TatA/TatE family subunit [Candidatus Marinimicrobia bacterium]|nr:twin-arginine translocase TatA/TatE family subunit [Candidatus Neomarinimicrobiota bacterium]
MSFPGGWEWILIFVVLLLLFGAKRLPELARGLGKGISEFRKAAKEVSNEIKQEELDKPDDEKDKPEA